MNYKNLSLKKLLPIVKTINDEEFTLFCTLYTKKQNKRFNKKTVKKNLRKLITKRYPYNCHNIYTKRDLSLLYNNSKMKESAILEALFPNRKNNWKKISKRTDNKKQEINIENFSFIDNPENTLEIFKKIAELEATKPFRTCELNYLDKTIDDISPYLLLGEITKKMFPFIRGGKISENLKYAMRPLKLDEFLGITGVSYPDKIPNILALPVYTRRDKNDITKDITTSSSRDYISFKVCEQFNFWLQKISELSNTKVQLSNSGKSYLGNIIGEILDNAEKYAYLDKNNGDWNITCFMEFNQQKNEYKCCLSIFNEGISIAKSIQNTKVKSVKDNLNDYINKNRKYDKDLLSTVFALQDNSTVDNGSSCGGLGMMHIVNFIKLIGKNNHKDKQPQLVIISGNSYIKFSGDYLFSTNTNEIGNRYQWFNKNNTLSEPPDEKNIFCLKNYVAGTIISTRFYLDKEVLTNE